MFLAYINKVGGQSLDARSNLAVLDMHAGLPHNFVNDIYEDTRGFIWISTYGGGLTRYDGYSFLSFTFGNRRLSLRSNSCRNVVEDRFGRLWVSFDEGTDVIDLNSYQKAEITSKVGDINKIIGLDHFGASAPYKVLEEKFGFTPELVAQRILSMLK